MQRIFRYSGLSIYRFNVNEWRIRQVGDFPDIFLTASNILFHLYQKTFKEGKAMLGVLKARLCSPLWAGFCALVNQQALASGKVQVGFINPAVYAIGQNSKPDITE